MAYSFLTEQILPFASVKDITPKHLFDIKFSARAELNFQLKLGGTNKNCIINNFHLNPFHHGLF